MKTWSFTFFFCYDCVTEFRTNAILCSPFLIVSCPAGREVSAQVFLCCSLGSIPGIGTWDDSWSPGQKGVFEMTNVQWNYGLLNISGVKKNTFGSNGTQLTPEKQFCWFKKQQQPQLQKPVQCQICFSFLVIELLYLIGNLLKRDILSCFILIGVQVLILMGFETWTSAFYQTRKKRIFINISKFLSDWFAIYLDSGQTYFATTGFHLLITSISLIFKVMCCKKSRFTSILSPAYRYDLCKKKHTITLLLQNSVLIIFV